MLSVFTYSKTTKIFSGKRGRESHLIAIFYVPCSIAPSEDFIIPPFNYVRMLTETYIKKNSSLDILNVRILPIPH